MFTVQWDDPINQSTNQPINQSDIILNWSSYREIEVEHSFHIFFPHEIPGSPGAFGHDLFLQAGQGHFTGLLVLGPSPEIVVKLHPRSQISIYKVPPPKTPKIVKLTSKWLNSVVYDTNIYCNTLYNYCNTLYNYCIHGVERGVSPCMIQCSGPQMMWISFVVLWLYYALLLLLL